MRELLQLISIHFHGHTSHDQFQREHHTQLFFLRANTPTMPAKKPDLMRAFSPSTSRGEAQTCAGEPRMQSLDFKVRQRKGSGPEPTISKTPGTERTWVKSRRPIRAKT